ncbi:MAG: glycine zipper domain-containing protein, partial [Nevskiales bacterium]
MDHIKIILISACVAGIAACADDPNRRAKIGAATGAVIGAAVGNQVDKGQGKYVGAVVGAIAGGAVGHYMDEQQKKLQKELAQEAARNELSIVRMSEDTLKVGVASDVSFDVDSAEIKLNARQTYDKIASVLKDYDKTIIHV